MDWKKSDCMIIEILYILMYFVIFFIAFQKNYYLIILYLVQELEVCGKYGLDNVHHIIEKRT